MVAQSAPPDRTDWVCRSSQSCECATGRAARLHACGGAGLEHSCLRRCAPRLDSARAFAGRGTRVAASSLLGQVRLAQLCRSLCRLGPHFEHCAVSLRTVARTSLVVACVDVGCADHGARFRVCIRFGFIPTHVWANLRKQHVTCVVWQVWLKMHLGAAVGHACSGVRLHGCRNFLDGVACSCLLRRPTHQRSGVESALAS